jgi:hypothetical protein
MLLTEEEKKEVIKNVKSAYVKEVERRVLERILDDNAERIGRYAAGESENIAGELQKLFPL